MSCILGPFSALTPAQDITLSSIAATLAGLTGRTVTLTAPVAAGGNLTVIVGDSYQSQDGRALTFTSSGWPSLAGATVTLKASSRQTGAALTMPITVVQAAGPGMIALEFTSQQTSAMEKGDDAYRFQVVATLADGSTATLVSATISVR